MKSHRCPGEGMQNELQEKTCAIRQGRANESADARAKRTARTIAQPVLDSGWNVEYSVHRLRLVLSLSVLHFVAQHSRAFHKTSAFYQKFTPMLNFLSSNDIASLLFSAHIYPIILAVSRQQRWTTRGYASRWMRVCHEYFCLLARAHANQCLFYV